MAEHPATTSELTRARREGRVPFSSVAVFAAAWWALVAVLPTVRAGLVASMRTMLRALADPSVNALHAASSSARAAVVPVLGALVAVALASSLAVLAQTRGAKIRDLPDARDVDPPRARDALFGAVLAAVVFGLSLVHVTELPRRLGVVLLVAAAADVAWRQWHWKHALRSTDDERRRASRDDEGDPAMKRERARRQRISGTGT